MGNGAFRERQFPPAEVRRILRQAADLAENDPATATTQRALTREDLERLGGELGLAPETIRAAIDGGPSTSTPDDAKERRLVHEDTLDGEIPLDRHEQVAATMRKILDAGQMADGAIEVIGRTLTWKTQPRSQRQLTVSLRSRDGRTHVRIEENLKPWYRGMQVVAWVSFFPVMSLIGLGLGRATLSVAVVVAVVLAALAGAIFGPTKLYSVTERRRRADNEARLTRLRDLVRDTVERTDPAKVKTAWPTTPARWRPRRRRTNRRRAKTRAHGR